MHRFSGRHLNMTVIIIKCATVSLPSTQPVLLRRNPNPRRQNHSIDCSPELPIRRVRLIRRRAHTLLQPLKWQPFPTSNLKPLFRKRCHPRRPPRPHIHNPQHESAVRRGPRRPIRRRRRKRPTPFFLPPPLPLQHVLSSLPPSLKPIPAFSRHTRGPRAPRQREMHLRLRLRWPRPLLSRFCLLCGWVVDHSDDCFKAAGLRLCL